MGNKSRAAALVMAGLLLAGCSSGDGDKDKPGSGSGNRNDKAFFLPSAEEVRNTTNPRLIADRSGNVHAVYPAYSTGDAFYAYCGSECDEDRVVSVKLPTQGAVHNAMIAIGPDNKPQILLSTMSRVYYATCEGDCSQESGWTSSVILEHDGDYEVSGEAFAVTPDGKPRFIMHSLRRLYGSSNNPGTWYVTCEDDCHEPSQWARNKIDSGVWQESSLRFTSDGLPLLATVLTIDGQDMGAYLECDTDCDTEDGWFGVTVLEAFSDRWIQNIDPAISMELATSDKPRLVMLGVSEGVRNIAYYECDQNCAQGDSWYGGILLSSEEIGAGLDLVLDSADRPRFVYTADYNILLGHCNERCSDLDAPWKLTKVEYGSEMKPDKIFPYPNCTVGAWFLRSPSIALGADGLPRVAYRALDISGGTTNPDPTKPPCVAGPDMTFARFMHMSGY